MGATARAQKAELNEAYAQRNAASRRAEQWKAAYIDLADRLQAIGQSQPGGRPGESFLSG